MVNRKIFGYIFIALAVLLAMTIVGQLPSLFGAIIGFFRIFTGSLETGQIGYVLGKLFYWIAHIAITIALWTFGRKWTKAR